MTMLRRVLLCLLFLSSGASAFAQQTGSIVGAVSDSSGAVMPGVTVTLTSDRLISGTETAVSDANGSYRFDRLPPGNYTLKFELQGFKTVERAEIAISAAFVATIN